MLKEIRVPMKRGDSIEEVMPYVEKIAQPGMRVVFLFHYPVDGFEEWGRASWATEETGIHCALEARKMAERYSWEGQKRLAKMKIFSACEVLSQRETEVGVDIYSGSLRRAVRSYALKGDVHCVMMRAGIGLRIKRFWHGTMPIRGLFKRPSFSPVLLLHPGTLV